jgi:hypothetical protein
MLERENFLGGQPNGEKELTTDLDEEREDVTADKDLSDPCCPDNRMVLGINESDDAAEKHIY